MILISLSIFYLIYSFNLAAKSDGAKNNGNSGDNRSNGIRQGKFYIP